MKKIEQKQVDRGTKVVDKKMYRKIMDLRKRGYSFGRIAELTGISRSSAFQYGAGRQTPKAG